MNLHLSTDDKFLDYFIENAERYSQTKNTYVVLSRNDKLIYTKSKRVIHIQPTVENFKYIYNKLFDIKRVYLHGLTEIYADMVFACNLHEKHRLIWLFFGHEVFDLQEYRESLFLPETKKYYHKNEDTIFRFSLNPIQLRRNFINYNHYKKKQKLREDKLKRLICSIHVFAHFIKEDYEMFVKPLNPKIEFIEWNYIGNNQFLFLPIPYKKLELQSTTIMLGNSASIFNNHLDGLMHLKTYIDSKNINKIICPLSYSGKVNYVETVKAYGKFLFGDKFIPLDKFLPKEDYFKLLNEIDIAVYFNLRSQAAGNILYFIKNNIPVFMHPENTLFKSLQESGFMIDTINDLGKNELYLSQENNKITLDKVFGEAAMNKKYKNLLSTNGTVDFVKE